LTGFFYGNILQSPNDYMFASTGDGIKNYFTYSYHIAHNQSATNFEGMNYPYGESYLYTDCHPVLASVFKFLAPTFPFFATHSVGILNVLMLLSFFLSFIAVYALLNQFKLNRWLSVLFSITIVMLAPQLFRLEGHLALSYSLAIPLSWYLMIRCLKTKSKRLLFVLLINNVFWLFIHAYLGVIVLFFLLSIVLIHLLFEKEKSSRWKGIFPLHR